MEIKSKIKKMALIIMSLFTMVLAVMGNVASIKAMEVDNEVEVTEWKQISDYHYLPVECTVGNVDISYTYDENNYRTSKTVDGVVTTYVYEECVDANNKTVYRLISECRAGETINYYYDMLSVDKVVSFTYEDEFYGYLYDDYGNINGIEKDNVQLCSYSYTTDGRNSVDYDISNNNISDVNRLFFEACYYDEETGYYYVNGSYNDLKNGRAVNKNLSENKDVNTNTRTNYHPTALFDQDVYNCVNYYSGIASYKAYLPDGAWTTGMSTVEVLARTIYGEFNGEASLSIYGIQPEQYYAQRTAVAWVIRNRMSCTSEFSNTLSGVVKEENQFKALTGSYDQTKAARNLEKGHDAWSEALELAAILYCATNNTYGSYTADELIARAAPKPQGIDKQKYFVSKQIWEDGYTERLHIFHFPEEQDRIVKNIALNVGNIPTNLPRNIFFDFK